MSRLLNQLTREQAVMRNLYGPWGFGSLLAIWLGWFRGGWKRSI